jgi:hypothetical protein
VTGVDGARPVREPGRRSRRRPVTSAAAYAGAARPDNGKVQKSAGRGHGGAAERKPERLPAKGRGRLQILNDEATGRASCARGLERADPAFRLIDRVAALARASAIDTAG